MEPSFDLVQQAVASIPSTEKLYARELMEKYPELGDHPTALIDLAYEEYCRAIEHGESIDTSLFAARFPEVEESLLELLNVHDFLAGTSLILGPETEVDWPTVGEEFLGYRLMEPLGEGAFSRVFLAREPELGNRRVVVKITGKQDNEAKFLGRLDHPNIVAIHSKRMDEVVNLTALCMPFLGRTTIADWIRARFRHSKFNKFASHDHLKSVINIGMGVCRGLEYAHSRDVLHCDVKPSNVLISDDGEPVLLDFNLSADPASEKFLLGGTIVYMAPEQLSRALGDSTATINPQTDVFCLGATLFEMATGYPAFPINPRSRLKEALLSALDQRRTFPNRSLKLPDVFATILRDSMAFNPEERIGSPQELMDRLASCEVARSKERKTKLLKSASIVGLMFLGAIFSLSWFRSFQKGKDTKPETLERFDPSSESKKIITPNSEGTGFRQKTASVKTQTISPKSQGMADHSLAFELLMNRDFSGALEVLARIPATELEKSSHRMNYSAALSLLALDSNIPPDAASIREVLFSLRKSDQTNSNLPEYHQLTATFHLLLARQNLGRDEDSAIRRAQFHAHQALALGHSKSQVYALTQVFSQIGKVEPFSSLSADQSTDPPNLLLKVPVRSPKTGEIHFLEASVPQD